MLFAANWGCSQQKWNKSLSSNILTWKDFSEGADIIMVKPAMAYLDIIHLLRENFPIPVAAYQVSGEYSMIKFAAAAGAIDEERAVLESLFSIRRDASAAHRPAAGA